MTMLEDFQFDKVEVKHHNDAPTGQKYVACTQCGKKSTFFVSQVNAMGKVFKRAFCVYHAIQAGLFHPKAYDLLGTGLNPLHRPTETTCRCGTTESLLKLKGRVGCAQCYTTFSKLLKPLLPKIQNATAHAGKAPRKMAPVVNVRRQVDELHEAMQRAIKVEAYEQAAVCRDEITKILAKAK